jgi:hypothetical protein
MTEILPGFGYTLEEMQEAQAELIAQREAEKLASRAICICGHSMGSHSEFAREGSVGAVMRDAGRITCRPTSIKCPCKKFDPAIHVSHIRKFLSMTDGRGRGHALARGMAIAAAAGVSMQWAVEADCRLCRVKPGLDVVLVPCAINERGEESDRPEVINVLLCESCRVTVQPRVSEV